MRFKSSKIIASVAVIGAVAAGGAAFTASNTVSGNQAVAGYSTTDVSGATVTGLGYTLSGDGASIEGAHLVFSPALADNATVKAGFTAGVAAWTRPGIANCDVAVGGATADCTLSSATTDADHFHLTVEG